MWLTSRARSGTLLPSLVIIALLFLMGLVPVGPTIIYVLTLSMAWAVVAIGLDVFFGYLGQASFGQAAFVAMGAYLVTDFREMTHIPFLPAAALAILATSVVAFLFGLVMVQLQHFGFVISTFFLGFVVAALLSGQLLSRFTHSESGLTAPVPTLGGVTFSQGSSLYYGSWVALLIAVVLSTNLVNGHWGRGARLIKRSELVAEVMGVNVKREKARGFAYAGTLAGLGGVLIAVIVGSIAPESFGATQSVNLFAMAVVGGLGSITGPILGALFFTLLPQFFVNAGNEDEVIFAVVFLAALIFAPEGIYGAVDAVARRIMRAATRSGGVERVTRILPAFSASRGRLSEQAPRGALGPPADPRLLASVETGAGSADRMDDGGDLAIDAHGVHVAFSGLSALTDVELRVSRGTVHALIGANGAGKTTLLNCLTGIQPIDSGHILLMGKYGTPFRSADVKRCGVSRTFQNPSLVSDLTALENVMLGVYSDHRVTVIRDLAGKWLSASRERHDIAAAQAALELVDLPRNRWGIEGRELALAEQKLVDLARAIAATASVVLLDEPTAGLSAPEVTKIASVLRSLIDTGQYTFVLISHSLDFVGSLADRVTVLDFGRVIAEGSPGSIANDPAVARAFLGSSATTGGTR